MASRTLLSCADNGRVKISRGVLFDRLETVFSAAKM